ncbi:hypothetical protein [Candidatus Nitrososphaera gargensis]|uniref:hypothetical protein n=1 Tax=Candidatus Nitrososphaera gargensis TaxID=497727 RepID=UPI0011E527A8|nr:hypothetical protein [Candidatus Nitrososphaera gargensis]
MEVRGSKAADMAFDITKVPTMASQPEKEGDVRRGAAESGTTHFFMYASTYVMLLYGRRFTLALKHVVRADESMADVIRYLLHEVQKRAGVRIKCLFLDKGFFTAAAVISYLNSVHIPYIMAAFPRGEEGRHVIKTDPEKKGQFRCTGLRNDRLCHRGEMHVQAVCRVKVLEEKVQEEEEEAWRPVHVLRHWQRRQYPS